MKFEKYILKTPLTSASRICMKRKVQTIKNAKIFSTTEKASTKVSARWFWNRHRERGWVRVWLPGDLQLRGWEVRYSRQPEGRQVRGLQQERPQQRQEPTVRHLLRVVSHQGRRTLTFCVHPPSQVCKCLRDQVVCGQKWWFFGSSAYCDYKYFEAVKKSYYFFFAFKWFVLFLALSSLYVSRSLFYL